MTLLSILLASASAFLVGLSKTGLPGVSILGIVLMTEAYPRDARYSVAAIVPVLLVGDVFAVAWFRRHADWGRLVRLLPWVLLGMIPGVFALREFEGNRLRPIIGGLVLGMLAIELCRQWFGWQRMPHRWWFAAATGFLAGFTTFVANAAMPVMTIYLVSQDFDKQRFIGTAAWFFLILNVSKVPPYCAMGMLTWKMLPTAAALAPLVILGALVGVYVLARIPQRFFDALALVLAGMAAIRFVAT
ncbi:MAG: sulfite exporter TauE/SafE family protein [Thermoguttaceae bacterium]|jgi:uncharacterized membrane protein YfcA